MSGVEGSVIGCGLSALAHRINIPDLTREKMLLVASELVHNNIKHAEGRGMIQHRAPIAYVIQFPQNAPSRQCRHQGTNQQDMVYPPRKGEAVICINRKWGIW